ncbi:ATP-binding cassette domain-containing protein, partial [Daejeonella sp.]|uniref:ATP-binding cassette domain-containing protein n=1 Tax=Daejeonella sp. TaxID=2805397 RepID=UPI0037842708
MIEIQGLKKGYYGVNVVNIPQLTIKKGESIGLIGNNGAGKTTLFRMILDLIRPDAGEVLSQEKNVSSTEIWKEYTASYLDEGFLIDHLTPEEYFQFIGGLHNKNKTQVEAEL